MRFIYIFCLPFFYNFKRRESILLPGNNREPVHAHCNYEQAAVGWLVVPGVINAGVNWNELSFEFIPQQQRNFLNRAIIRLCIMGMQQMGVLHAEGAVK